jgi:hypothetical protein
MVRSEEFALNFASSSTKLQLKPTRWLMEAFGDKALSQARTSEWFKRFKDGHQVRSNIKSMLFF